MLILYRAPMPKSTTFILKSAVLALALVFESFMAVVTIFEFVAAQNYFSFDWKQLIMLGVWFLLLLWTHSLTVGGWGKWEQYVLVPFPIALGIMFGLFPLDQGWAVLGGLGAFLFLSFAVFQAGGLKNALVKFRSGIVFGPTTKGILLVFSVLAAGLVLMYASEPGQEIDVTEKFSDFAVENSSMFLPVGLPLSQAALKQIIEVEFNRMIAPYQDYVHPVIAFVVFTIIGFVGSLAGLAFSLTSGFVLTGFKRVGFLRVYRSTVEKEEIGFESSTT